MRKVKASTRQNSNLVPISALACLPLNPVSLYSPASAHETRRKALVSRRNSIFSYYLEEPKQLLWPGRRQVQNGNLHIWSLERKQETSACYWLVSFTVSALQNPKTVVWWGVHVTVSHFWHHVLQKLERTALVQSTQGTQYPSSSESSGISPVECISHWRALVRASLDPRCGLVLVFFFFSPSPDRNSESWTGRDTGTSSYQRGWVPSEVPLGYQKSPVRIPKAQDLVKTHNLKN